MQIFIPTRGRVKSQVTWNDLPMALKKVTTLVCPAEELEEHLAAGRPAIARPDYVKGIAQSRQFISEISKDDKFIMIDDDMTFAVRNSPEAWNLRPCSPQDYVDLFTRMWDLLDKYPAVGITTRQNINVKYPKKLIEVTKINGCTGWDRSYMKFVGARFDDVKVQEDYHVSLSLLEAGYKNACIVDAAWNQGTGAAGGCSVYRTSQLQKEGSERLKGLHPEFVSVVEVEQKTSWGDLGNTRTDVNISWKKAFFEGTRVTTGPKGPYKGEMK